jgi:hypothetical protein
VGPTRHWLRWAIAIAVLLLSFVASRFYDGYHANQTEPSVCEEAYDLQVEIVLTPTNPDQASFNSWLGVSNEIVAKLSTASRYRSASAPEKADAESVVTEWDEIVKQDRANSQTASTYASDLEALAVACHLPPLATTKPRPS